MDLGLEPVYMVDRVWIMGNDMALLELDMLIRKREAQVELYHQVLELRGVGMNFSRINAALGIRHASQANSLGPGREKNLSALYEMKEIIQDMEGTYFTEPNPKAFYANGRWWRITEIDQLSLPNLKGAAECQARERYLLALLEAGVQEEQIIAGLCLGDHDTFVYWHKRAETKMRLQKRLDAYLAPLRMSK